MRPLITIVVLCVTAVPMAGAAADAQARDGDPVARGRALAQEFCGACHAVGRAGESRHAEAPPLRRLGNDFDLDDFLQRLRGGLLSNHPEMPEFRFDIAAARALRAYLRAIQE